MELASCIPYSLGVMWVQPIFRQPISSLKHIRATAYRFYYKNLRRRAMGVFFSGAEKFVAAVFICSRNFFQSIFFGNQRD